MGSLTERDAAALLDVVGELARLEDPLAFPPRLLEQIADLLDTPNAAYNVLDRRNERSIVYCGWNEGEELVETDDGSELPYWRLRHSHPVCSYRERELEWSPHTVSDFATLRQFRQTAIWDEIYRHEGIDYWLDMGLPPRHGCTRIFVLARGTRDFDERSKTMLRLLRPHLLRRAEAFDAVADAVEALAAVEDASEDARDIVLVGAGGIIEFASPRSRALLSRYFGARNGTLPERLRGLLEQGSRAVVTEDDDGRLTVRAAPAGTLHVLLLAEDDRRVERLTPRQRQVLAHVADGLTDAQIGERLDVAPATVTKHLESIYERLEVHNRTSAAAVYRR